MSTLSARRRSLAWIALIAAWTLCVGAGMYMLFEYKNTPGQAASAPDLWPGAARLPHASDRKTLLVFAHPRCTCTRATLTELSWLVQRHRDAMATHVVFLQPPGVDRSWLDSDTYKRVGEMQGVHRHVDHDGAEAKRFGAATSGQALLYDAEGRLLFAGGLTGSRGHEGDNAGRARVAALLRRERSDQPISSVFGCELDAPRSL